jgi:hypothetical protein
LVVFDLSNIVIKIVKGVEKKEDKEETIDKKVKLDKKKPVEKTKKTKKEIKSAIKKVKDAVEGKDKNIKQYFRSSYHNQQFEGNAKSLDYGKLFSYLNELKAYESPYSHQNKKEEGEDGIDARDYSFVRRMVQMDKIRSLVYRNAIEGHVDAFNPMTSEEKDKWSFMKINDPLYKSISLVYMSLSLT